MKSTTRAADVLKECAFSFLGACKHSQVHMLNFPPPARVRLGTAFLGCTTNSGLSVALLGKVETRTQFQYERVSAYFGSKAAAALVGPGAVCVSRPELSTDTCAVWQFRPWLFFFMKVDNESCFSGRHADSMTWKSCRLSLTLPFEQRVSHSRCSFLNYWEKFGRVTLNSMQFLSAYTSFGMHMNLPGRRISSPGRRGNWNPEDACSRVSLERQILPTVILQLLSAWGLAVGFRSPSLLFPSSEALSLWLASRSPFPIAIRIFISYINMFLSSFLAPNFFYWNVLPANCRHAGIFKRKLLTEMLS